MILSHETIKKLNTLPAEYASVLESYIDFLFSQIERKKKTTEKNKERKPGLLKGKLWIAPDFDEPLDDMKEYIE